MWKLACDELAHFAAKHLFGRRQVEIHSAWRIARGASGACVYAADSPASARMFALCSLRRGAGRVSGWWRAPTDAGA